MNLPLNRIYPDCPDTRVITGLALDSRRVETGNLFAAFPGSKVDGRAFIPQALSAGASAILCEPGVECDIPADVLLIEHANPRLAFAQMAARFYGQQPSCLVGVTGTNGKSSTVTFVREIWEKLGLIGASIGTIGIKAPGIDIYGSLTTPDSAALHKTIADLTERGVTHLAMEASSHGLDQYRLHGVRVTIAAFTNLSRDHLDYHPDMDSYLAAKEKLFSEVLSETGCAVLNADIPEYDRLAETCRTRGVSIISYGKNADTLKLLDHAPTAHGYGLTVQAGAKTYAMELPLIGYFQIENILCAAAIVHAGGADLDRIMEILPQLSGVPGRMELVGKTNSGGAIYVDFAHTPDALETALSAIRPHCTGKLVCLFGCGGDRDTGKRPQMGAVSAKHADVTFVSDDNPRSENPADIRADIMVACPDATEIDGRGNAITQAAKSLGDSDILLIAGKGHEEGQIIGDQVLPFNDARFVRDLIERGDV